MPRIPRSRSNFISSNVSSPRSTGGAGIESRGISQAAGRLGDLVFQLGAKRQRARDVRFAAEENANLDTLASAHLESLKDNAPADGSGISQSMGDFLDEFQSGVVDRAKEAGVSSNGVEMFDLKFIDTRSRQFQTADREERERAGLASMELYKNIPTQLAKSQSQSPNATHLSAQLDGFNLSVKEGLDTNVSALDSDNIIKSGRNKMEMGFFKGLLIKNRYNEGLRLLSGRGEGQKLTEDLTPEQHASLLASFTRAKKTHQDLSRSAAKTLIKNVENSLIKGVEVSPELQSRARAAVGIVSKDPFIRRLAAESFELHVRSSDKIKLIKQSTPTDASVLLSEISGDLKKTTKGDNSLVIGSVANRIGLEIKEAAKERSFDPQKAAKTNFPQYADNPEMLKKIQTEVFGRKNPRVLSEKDAAAIGLSISNAPKGLQGAAMLSVRSRFGKDSRLAFNDLAHFKSISPEVLFASEVQDPIASEKIISTNNNFDLIKTKFKDNGFKRSSVITAVNADAVLSNLDASLTETGDDFDRMGMSQAIKDTIAKRAMLFMNQGIAVDEAVKRSREELFDRSYEIISSGRNTILAPRMIGSDPVDLIAFKNYVDAANSSEVFKALDIAVPPDYIEEFSQFGELSADATKERFYKDLERGLSLRPNDSRDGLRHMYVGNNGVTNFLRNESGDLVELEYLEMSGAKVLGLTRSGIRGKSIDQNKTQRNIFSGFGGPK